MDKNINLQFLKFTSCVKEKKVLMERNYVVTEEAYRKLEKIDNDVNYDTYSIKEIAEDICKKFKLLLKEERKLMKKLKIFIGKFLIVCYNRHGTIFLGF